MLDEAHERTLYTDIAIGLLKKVMSADAVSGLKSKGTARPSLKLLITSPAMKIILGKLWLNFLSFRLSISIHTLTFSSTDSEEEARPAADCGLCHSGCQGDCIIKMNRYAWLARKEKQRQRRGELMPGQITLSWHLWCTDKRETQSGHDCAQH